MTMLYEHSIQTHLVICSANNGVRSMC